MYLRNLGNKWVFRDQSTANPQEDTFSPQESTALKIGHQSANDTGNPRKDTTSLLE